jgi:hypothetical protein
MLQNCGAGRNECAERRSLAALQRHSEGNVSGVPIEFAVNTTTQIRGFLKNKVFALWNLITKYGSLQVRQRGLFIEKLL